MTNNKRAASFLKQLFLALAEAIPTDFIRT